MSHQATRYHDISCGHRVVGHEGKCRWLHGHNYRIHFTCKTTGEKELDEVGRVIDFSVLKDKLCTWVEAQWDHKFLMWEKDPYLEPFKQRFADIGIRVVPFNPTAENIARYLVEIVGPEELPKRVRLIKVTVEETRKCSASYEVPSV